MKNRLRNFDQVFNMISNISEVEVNILTKYDLSQLENAILMELYLRKIATSNIIEEDIGLNSKEYNTALEGLINKKLVNYNKETAYIELSQSGLELSKQIATTSYSSFIKNFDKLSEAEQNEILTDLQLLIRLMFNK